MDTNRYVPVLNEAPFREDVLGVGGMAPRILDLGTRRRWVVSFTPRPLYLQKKSPWYPLDRRLGVLIDCLDAVEKRKIPSHRRESNSWTYIVQPVASRYTDREWI
jgi:hypothetical protein